METTEPHGNAWPSGFRGSRVHHLYAKDRDRAELTGLVRTAADYPLEDKEGRYASTDLTIGMTEEERPNQAFTISNPRTGVEYRHNPDRVWRFEPGTMKQVIADNLVIWPDEHPGEMERPRFKTYFDPKNPKIKPVSSWIATTTSKAQDEDDEELQTIASGLNSEGGRSLRRILGSKLFDYPKPPSLIRSLVRLATSADDIVLDSFSGSGTAGQAVLEQNAEDGGTRRFVLVQLHHDNKEQEAKSVNVCAAVTAARMRAIIGGYTCTNGKKQKIEGLGGAFSYARVGEPLFNEYRDFGETLPALRGAGQVRILHRDEPGNRPQEDRRGERVHRRDRRCRGHQLLPALHAGQGPKP